MLEKKRWLKVLTMTLVVIMIIVIPVACGGDPEKTEKADSVPSEDSEKKTSEEQAPSDSKELSLPIVEEPLELTMWAPLRKAAQTMNDFNEKSCYQELERLTGIRIKWQHPPAGQESEQFNLMIASGDLPDLIWGGHFTSVQEALDQKSIIPLNDLIDEYAPNFKKVMEEYPTIHKSVMTDDDQIFGFPFSQTFLQAAGTGPQGGPQIRKDWLDKLDLPIPETLDEWKAVLKSFKENDPNGNGKQDEIPFASDGNGKFSIFFRAFGITKDFCMKDGPLGTVTYGPIEPAFKETLAYLHDLYVEGLIDKDYLTTDRKLLDSKMTNNLVGATSGNTFGDLGGWTGLMLDDPDFLLWAAPSPKKDSDSVPYFEMGRVLSMQAGVGFVTTANKHPEESVRWYDFGYTEQGGMIFNFGKEGVSYNMVDGYPKYTDEVLRNPEGLSTTVALAKHSMASDEANFLQDPRYCEQIVGSTPAQRQAWRTWGTGFDKEGGTNNLSLPPIQLTADESARSATIMNDINTYRDEMIDKFITGQESLEDFGKFVEQIKSMGIEEAIKIRQDAHERWVQRGGVDFIPAIEEADLDYSKTDVITEKGYDDLDPDLK